MNQSFFFFLSFSMAIKSFIIFVLYLFYSVESQILHHAKSASLRFGQRMYYSHAPKVAEDILAEINAIADHSSDDSKILRALLLFGCGALDAAHEIVQTMSTLDAIYIHSLLHRCEGNNIGENMMQGIQYVNVVNLDFIGITYLSSYCKGWSNADYWNDQVGTCHPNFSYVFEHVFHLSTTASSIYSANELVQCFQQKLMTSNFSSDHRNAKQWRPSLFLGLCIDGSRKRDLTCTQFCEHVTTYEFRLLLQQYCEKFLLDKSETEI